MHCIFRMIFEIYLADTPHQDEMRSVLEVGSEQLQELNELLQIKSGQA